MDTRNRAADAAVALRSARILVAGYLAVSALAVAALVLLRNHPTLATDASWIRAGIVLASALLTFAFAARAARGHRRAYLRLRIVSAVMVVAIVVIVALPGFLPGWLRIEQGACGLLLLAVVLLVNRRRVRAVFASI